MKRFIAFYLMLFVSIMPAMPIEGAEVVLEESAESVQQLSAKEADIKAKAELLGLGAEIKILMRRASSRGHSVTHRGIIDEISAESLSLLVKDKTQRIQYDQIEKLSFTKNKYKARGQVDSIAVRRVVVELGIGKKVQLKRGSDQKSKGKIQSIASDNFTIINSQTGLIETVPFNNVTEIQQSKMPAWAKAAIIGGAVFAGLLIAAVATLSRYD